MTQDPPVLFKNNTGKF